MKSVPKLEPSAMQAGLVWTSSHRTSTGKFLGARWCMALSDRLNNIVRFRYRDPRWGRGQETPGEDIFRTSQYTKSLLMGLMGGCWANALRA